MLLAIFFGAAHGLNPGESYVGLVSPVSSDYYSASASGTRIVGWAIGFHKAWNWGVTFFYGTPNYGLLAAGKFLSIASWCAHYERRVYRAGGEYRNATDSLACGYRHLFDLPICHRRCKSLHGAG